MQRHTTSYLENNSRKGFSVGIRWLGDRSLHTTKSIAQMFLGSVFNVLSHLHDFVADLIACRLDNFMSCMLWHVDQ
jgi:hypothetical protein